MKLSENWLREWVNPNLDSKQLASLLTMAGLEVDAVSAVAGQFEGVIVAEVISTSPHPEADKLTICTVDAGFAEKLQIVCGASNVRPGLKVALAKLGACLPQNFVIKEVKLRGILSQGMLCSASELGMADNSEGILELDETAPIGQDIRKYFALDDHILDIDLTPNRADCLSIIGVARELAALTKTKLKLLDVKVIKPTIDTKKTIEVKEAEACPFYAARIIGNLNSHAKTPLWMQEYLRRSGLRSIHPIVDVINYLMLELGQPMHAFDLDKLKGNITVRYAKDSETLTLLDGQKIALKPKVLVIADSNNPVALAGVMGGKDSAVDENTTNILLESAYFSPATISGVARQYGLRTDSSQRFERGVDASLALKAMERATNLLAEILGGEVGPISQQASDFLPKPITILFSPAKVKQITGLDIPTSFMQEVLENLGMTIKEKDSFWQVAVPSYRQDLSLDVDLVEEIIRLYGYDKIPGAELAVNLSAGSINPTDSLIKTISDFFRSRGYNESISYSFVDPKLQEILYPHVEKIKLLNPISPDLSQMRLGLWPGLLASILYNSHRQQASVKLFESGVVFEKSNSKIEEIPKIAGAIMGDYGAVNWSEPQRKFDFYDVKGDLQALFSSLKLKGLSFESGVHSALHPGKTAFVKLDDKLIASCGVLHPKIADVLGLNEEVILFEMDLGSLINPSPTKYKPISKFPQIRRDLSLLVDEEIPVSKIEALIKSMFHRDWLKSFDVFDVYRDKSIARGKKSLALALTIQDQERTLIDNEINELINAIIKKLQDEFSITLRE